MDYWTHVYDKFYYNCTSVTAPLSLKNIMEVSDLRVFIYTNCTVSVGAVLVHTCT